MLAEELLTVAHLVVVLAEPDQQALASHVQLVLNKVEVVGLLAHVVRVVDRVADLQHCVRGIKQAYVYDHIGLVFSKLAVFIDAEMLSGELLPVDQ